MTTLSFPMTEELLLEVAQQLPAAPRLLAALGDVVRRPHADADEVVSLLRRDPALVARVLRVANSAAYARAQPLDSVEGAVVAVGFVEIYRLVGALAAEDLGDEELTLHGISAARLRANALFVGTLMEELGARAGLEPAMCYATGLLRPLGKAVLDRIGRRMPERIPAFAASAESSVIEWERRHWGIEAWAAGAVVLRHWQFSPEVVSALAQHPAPEKQAGNLAHLLVLAVGIAARDGYGLPGDPAEITADGVEASGVSLAAMEMAVERAEETFKRLRASVV